MKVAGMQEICDLLSKKFPVPEEGHYCYGTKLCKISPRMPNYCPVFKSNKFNLNKFS